MFTKYKIRTQLQKFNFNDDDIKIVLNSLPSNRNFHHFLTCQRVIMNSKLPAKIQQDMIVRISQIGD